MSMETQRDSRRLFECTLIAVLEKARVAESSRFWASAVAAGSSLVRARPVACGGALAAELDAGGCSEAGGALAPWPPNVKLWREKSAPNPLEANASWTYLVGGSGGTWGGVESVAADNEARLALRVLGGERKRTSTALEGEELAVRDLAATVGATTT